MKRALAPLCLCALCAAADTAPLGALRSASPVVTNEVDAAWLEWLTNSTAILLGSGASNRAGGAAIPWVTRDISIGAGAESCESVSIGWGSTSGVYSAAVGPDTYAGRHAAAVGDSARAADGSVAIGHGALAAAPDSIQIGEGRNAEGGTVQVGDWQLLDSRGIIPPARLGAMPLRANLYSGAGCTADPAVFLYWCTNCEFSTSFRFPVGARLPADSDAMAWDLWITASSHGFSPSQIDGVSWVGPNGPPDASDVAPGNTMMLRCTAVRLPPTNVVVLAEWRATVALSPAGVAPLPPRVPGRIRVKPASIPVMADGSADVYTVGMSAASFATVAAIPDGADGLDYEIWIRNTSSTNLTPTVATGGGTLVGTMPTIPAGGNCILRCRAVHSGAHATDVRITVEGATPAGRGAPAPEPETRGGGEEPSEGDGAGDGPEPSGGGDER